MSWWNAKKLTSRVPWSSTSFFTSATLSATACRILYQRVGYRIYCFWHAPIWLKYLSEFPFRLTSNTSRSPACAKENSFAILSPWLLILGTYWSNPSISLKTKHTSSTYTGVDQLRADILIWIEAQSRLFCNTKPWQMAQWHLSCSDETLFIPSLSLEPEICAWVWKAGLTSCDTWACHQTNSLQVRLAKWPLTKHFYASHGRKMCRLNFKF